MQPDVTADYRAVRRAYEWGRLRASVVRAMLVTVAIGAVACAFTGPRALAWLPVTFTAWLLVHWRGGPILRGSLFGLVAGAITYALPMTILRPCCSPEKMMVAGENCCTMPSACVGAGAAIGFVLAAFVPASAARWRTALGMGLGVASVAILRCSTLFLSEAGGLLGGLVGGVLVAAAARSVLAQHARASR